MKTTASRLPLLARCPSAGALSAVWVESTADQAAGTHRHRFLQRASEVGRDEALAALPDDATLRAQCEALPLEEIPHGIYEQAYAYDTATDEVRYLGAWIERAYVTNATEVSGTVDLACPPTADRPRWLVIDFKGEEEVDDASTNLQLGFYAACVARSQGVDEVDVAIVNIGRDGALRWDRATLGFYALAAVFARVTEIQAAVAAAAVEARDYTMGWHCRRCPALVSCPAQTAAIAKFHKDPPTPERLARMSDADVGVAYSQIKTFEEAAKRARDAILARLSLGDLPLDNGSVLTQQTKRTRTVVLEKAEPLLRERFGDRVDAVIDRDLSVAGVNKLVKLLAPGKGQRKVADELWGALATIGGVVERSHVQPAQRKGKGPVIAESDE